MSSRERSFGYDRVRAHASELVNAKIDRVTEGNLRRAAAEPAFVTQRLGELDREWELDRTILLAFATMGSVALGLGLRRNWRWRFPLTAQTAFLVLHAVVGWCPPAVVLRRLGFRTRQEIDGERQALLSARHAGFAQAQ